MCRSLGFKVEGLRFRGLGLSFEGLGLGFRGHSAMEKTTEKEMDTRFMWGFPGIAALAKEMASSNALPVLMVAYCRRSGQDTRTKP